MNKRIVWSKAERDALFNSTIEVIAQGKWLDNRNILRHAQEIFPPDRRRKVTDGMIFNYKNMLTLARNEAHIRVRDRKLTEVALQTAAPVTPPAPAPVELSLGELFERLVSEVTRRVTADVRQVLAEQQSSAVPAPAPVAPGVNNSRERLAIIDAPSQRKRKPIVLIIGLNGQQITITKRNHPDIDVICLTPEDALSRSPIRADHTVLMTKFINHGVQSKYRQVPNLRYCNGGVSDLASILQMIRMASQVG